MSYYYPTYSPPYAAQPYAQPPRMGEAGQGYPQPMQSPPAPSQSQMSSFASSGGQSFGARPVTSREEALALQVDFLGPGTIMPDLSHGKIYLKRFNPSTGSCDFFTFLLEQPEEKPAPPAVEYATREELRQLREELERLRGGSLNEV